MALQEQMSMFDEGGMLDEGDTVDPVSGNDVPVGALKEEVRDDVPANVSPGEFVVSAATVRFHGLDKFMKLRDEAMQGMARMESIGQMGNSDSSELDPDTPFSQEDLVIVMGGPPEEGMPSDDKPMEANRGGSVLPTAAELGEEDPQELMYLEGGLIATSINDRPPSLVPKFDRIVEYVNGQGEITFISLDTDGNPMGYVDPDSRPVDTATMGTEASEPVNFTDYSPNDNFTPNRLDDPRGPDDNEVNAPDFGDGSWDINFFRSDGTPMTLGERIKESFKIMSRGGIQQTGVDEETGKPIFEYSSGWNGFQDFAKAFPTYNPAAIVGQIVTGKGFFGEIVQQFKRGGERVGENNKEIWDGLPDGTKEEIIAQRPEVTRETYNPNIHGGAAAKYPGSDIRTGDDLLEGIDPGELDSPMNAKGTLAAITDAIKFAESELPTKSGEAQLNRAVSLAEMMSKEYAERSKKEGEGGVSFEAPLPAGQIPSFIYTVPEPSEIQSTTRYQPGRGPEGNQKTWKNPDGGPVLTKAQQEYLGSNEREQEREKYTGITPTNNLGAPYDQLEQTELSRHQRRNKGPFITDALGSPPFDDYTRGKPGRGPEPLKIKDKDYSDFSGLAILKGLEDNPLDLTKLSLPPSRFQEDNMKREEVIKGPTSFSDDLTPPQAPRSWKTPVPFRGDFDQDDQLNEVSRSPLPVEKEYDVDAYGDFGYEADPYENYDPGEEIPEEVDNEAWDYMAKGGLIKRKKYNRGGSVADSTRNLFAGSLINTSLGNSRKDAAYNAGITSRTNTTNKQPSFDALNPAARDPKNPNQETLAQRHASRNIYKNRHGYLNDSSVQHILNKHGIEYTDEGSPANHWEDEYRQYRTGGPFGIGMSGSPAQVAKELDTVLGNRMIMSKRMDMKKNPNYMTLSGREYGLTAEEARKKYGDNATLGDVVRAQLKPEWDIMREQQAGPRDFHYDAALTQYDSFFAKGKENDWLQKTKGTLWDTNRGINLKRTLKEATIRDMSDIRKTLFTAIHGKMPIAGWMEPLTEVARARPEKWGGFKELRDRIKKQYPSWEDPRPEVTANKGALIQKPKKKKNKTKAKSKRRGLASASY
jgi:hypothetical protein